MKCVVNLFSDPNLNFEKFYHSPKYSGANAEISKLWGSEKLDFHMEALDPKSFSCPNHLHHQEEELFIVFKGSTMVRQDEEFYEVKMGAE